MEFKTDGLSCVICDVFKMQQNNGLLLHDKEKWSETQVLMCRIQNCLEISALVPICHLIQDIYHK